MGVCWLTCVLCITLGHSIHAQPKTGFATHPAFVTTRSPHACSHVGAHASSMWGRGRIPLLVGVYGEESLGFSSVIIKIKRKRHPQSTHNTTTTHQHIKPSGIRHLDPTHGTHIENPHLLKKFIKNIIKCF